MALTEETKAAVKARRESHGDSHRRALAYVMAARAAADWNARWPVGTPCALEVVKGGASVETRTRSVAWVVGDHASVLLVGHVGGYALKHLRPGVRVTKEGCDE